MEVIKHIAHQLRLNPSAVAATVALFDAGNTAPFVARYRQEATGGLDDEQVQHIHQALKRARALEERRETIVRSITEQDKLTPELAAQLEAAETQAELEDLYTPYKPKRQTRASQARAAGLEPLAQLILRQPPDAPILTGLATHFINAQVPTAAHVWTGARDIVAEIISDNPGVRGALRRAALRNGLLSCQKNEEAADPKGVYTLYYEMNQPVASLRPHQILAINRGERDKILRVRLEVSEHDWLLALRTVCRPNPHSPLHDQLEQAMQDARQRLLEPFLERDVRRVLTESAESHAIQVFADNLKGLLSQPPLAGQTVLAIDPGFSTGCKVAVVDATGKVLDTAVIYPHPPQRQHDDALRRLLLLVNRHHVRVIAIGNGTASRESEQLVAELTRTLQDVQYLIVNEAGASVYSASELARTELPDLDVTLRGAVSIGRRVLDPLAELVKIDPQSIGVGLYQHDVDQKKLGEALASVVELIVNRVGVDINTASPSLLTYVSGIGPRLAEKIVAYRDATGPFQTRDGLFGVPGLGPKGFEQAAGFLRIRDGAEPLDASAIHPESYAVARAILTRAGVTFADPSAVRQAALEALAAATPLPALAADLQVGVPTLTDIFEQIVRPGRDPRQELPPPLLRKDVLSLADLRPGIRLHGTVRNLVDFGAFVDIGVKRDGLLHRSRIPVNMALNVGDVIQVSVLEVDNKRGRISLEWPPAET